MSQQIQCFYEFGEYRIATDERILKRGREVVPLPPKAVELLLVLLESGGRVLSKEELMERIWADSFVEEANLSQNVFLLRKALTSEKTGEKFIETIPRRGYRFVADVSQSNEPPNESIAYERTVSHIVVEEEIESDDFQIEAVNKTERRDNEISLPAQSSRDFLQKNDTRRKIPLWIVCGVLLIVSAAIGGWKFLGRGNQISNHITPQNIDIKRLTPDVMVYSPAISPDGTSVAYVLRDKEQNSLWRKNVSSGEATQLLPSAPVSQGDLVYTRFSPDGKFIYYGAYDDKFFQCNLFRIPANGGMPQHILGNLKSDFGISPDGKQIAFARDWKQLVVANADGSGEHVAAERDGINRLYGNDWFSSVSFSPDGTRIVLPGYRREQGRIIRELVEVNLASGNETLIPVPEDFAVYQVEWLADGSGLLVIRRKTTVLPGQIWYVAYPSGKTTRITSEADNYGFIRISADSRSLVAQQDIGHFNIWLAPIENPLQGQQISMGSAAAHGTGGVAFMPDGKIVYTSNQSGNMDLWLMNANGSQPRQLTVNAGTVNNHPKPTADGRYIIFNSTRSGASQVWRMDADGGNPIQLSKGEENWDIQLSSDKRFVYYITSAENNKKIFKVSIDGGEPIPVGNRYYLGPPLESPDGKWILYAGSETKDGEPHVGLIETATGKTVRFLDKIKFSSCWTADSKSIFFVDSLGQNLWSQPIDGGEPRLLGNSPTNLIYLFDLSPDNKKIAISLGNISSEAVLITNFR